MPHCTNPQTLNQFPAGDSRSNNRAEQAAAQARSEGHPQAHVHYNASSDALTVVEPRGGESR